MGSEDRFAQLTWMAGAFEIVGACGITDVPAVACVQLSDGHRWGRIVGRPLWREIPSSR